MKVISEKEVSGPMPGESDWVRFLTIDLNQIRTEPKYTKKKHGREKIVSSEDQFQMSALQPDCHWKDFTNEYYLSVEIIHDTFFEMKPLERHTERPLHIMRIAI